MIFMQRRYFSSEKIRPVIQALLLSAGDWQRAKDDLKNSAVDCAKLFTWADKIIGVAK